MTKDIYDPEFVRQVFDKCGRNYRYWSAIASFGFVARWRRQCVDALPGADATGAHAVDLMAGTGEIWPVLFRQRPNIARITAIDISHEMHVQALERLHKDRSHKIEHLEVDVLTNALPSGVADVVISTFGLKTFNPDQHAILAREVARVLKPGGVFSFIEAADPEGWAFRPLYRLYLDRVLPIIERIFLRGAQDFAMLGVYTKNFLSCSHFSNCLRREGLDVNKTSYFFGCASGVAGRKPSA